MILKAKSIELKEVVVFVINIQKHLIVLENHIEVLIKEQVIDVVLSTEEKQSAKDFVLKLILERFMGSCYKVKRNVRKQRKFQSHLIIN